jgi:hypothetical protein
MGLVGSRAVLERWSRVYSVDPVFTAVMVKTGRRSSMRRKSDAEV